MRRLYGEMSVQGNIQECIKRKGDTPSNTIARNVPDERRA